MWMLDFVEVVWQMEAAARSHSPNPVSILMEALGVFELATMLILTKTKKEHTYS